MYCDVFFYSLFYLIYDMIDVVILSIVSLISEYDLLDRYLFV